MDNTLSGNVQFVHLPCNLWSGIVELLRHAILQGARDDVLGASVGGGYLPGVYIIQITDISPPPFQNDIFPPNTVKISSFPPFSTSSPYIRVFLNKSSYFFGVLFLS